MILATYGGSGVLLLITAFFFHAGALNATTQTVLWSVIFFFASAGASSAYLTVSEIFPLELRGQAISFFFAISQLAGGVAAPFLFGKLIGDGSDRGPLTIGYYVGAGVMLAGGIIAWFFGVDAERKSLEDISDPLTSVRRTASAGSRFEGPNPLSR
jgi:MFS family permease